MTVVLLVLQYSFFEYWYNKIYQTPLKTAPNDSTFVIVVITKSVNKEDGGGGVAEVVYKER